MKRSGWWVAILAGAAAAQEPAHPLALHLDAAGRLYSTGGLRLSDHTLARDLANGYHNGRYDAVVLIVAPGSPPVRVAHVRAIVRAGPPGTRFIVRRER